MTGPPRERPAAETPSRSVHRQPPRRAERASGPLPPASPTRHLNVTDSRYYAWRNRGPSARAVRHALVTGIIRQVHQASRGTYGYRRVHAELTMGRGLVVGHGTVELLRARADVKGVTGAPKWRRTGPDMLATDLVDRRFTREGVNQL